MPLGELFTVVECVPSPAGAPAGGERFPEFIELGHRPEVGDFFHGWNPFPTAASANGGGLFELSLLH